MIPWVAVFSRHAGHPLGTLSFVQERIPQISVLWGLAGAAATMQYSLVSMRGCFEVWGSVLELSCELLLFV